MKRFQIGLRLLLLMVSLLAACFAWMGAVQSRWRAEHALKTINLEAQLMSEERWRESLRRELPSATSPSLRGGIRAQLKMAESRIASLRQELEASKQ